MASETELDERPTASTHPLTLERMPAPRVHRNWVEPLTLLVLLPFALVLWLLALRLAK